MIRHGITEGNKNRWFYGAADIPLAEEGRAQLGDLRDRDFYPAVPEDALYYTSGLVRTEETLRIIYGDRPHMVLPDLQEMNFGDYECRAFDGLDGDSVFMKWGYDEDGDIALPGGESRNEFTARVRRGLDELLALHIKNGRTSVLVCHGGPISCIMQQLFPGSKGTMWDWMPEPGHGYILDFDGRSLAGWEPLGKAGDSLQDAIAGYQEEHGLPKNRI